MGDTTHSVQSSETVIYHPLRAHINMCVCAAGGRWQQEARE